MNDQNNMESSGLNLSEIYCVFFRHKWKIILFSVAGVLAGAAYYLLNPTLYLSEAKLIVKYVQENKTVTPAKEYVQIQSPDAQGTSIINSEVEILSSMNLCLKVVDELGPETILKKSGKAALRNKAAGLLHKSLEVQAPNHGKIVILTYTHPDAAVAQAVLTKLIDVYMKKHMEIHRPSGMMDDLVSQEVINLRNHLTQTEQEVRKLKSKFNVIDVKEAKRKLMDEMSRIRQDRFTAEADLEEQRAALKELGRLSPSKASLEASEAGVPFRKLNEYRSLCAQLNSFLTKLTEYNAQFTPENPLVLRLQEQILQTDAAKTAMEKENPKLATLALPALGATTLTNGNILDLPTVSLRVKALEAKVTVLNSQYVSLKTEADQLDEAESAISELERQKELEETYLKSFSEGLQQAKYDAALGAGKVPNISIVQDPSPPEPLSRKVQKIAALLVLMGIGGGIALAFLIEMFLDQSVKRPIEIMQKLRLPLMMAIPWLGRNGQNGSKGKVEAGENDARRTGMELALWDDRHGLHPFHEALRDRLISYFEIKKMTHKPKLVAVTSCSKGAGVTTIATGLAAALSETGDGNVLLVDMGLQQGAAHPFYRGKPGCALAELLESGNRQDALVQENLYMVTAKNPGEQLQRALPKKFTNLVPKMKASDYDYIIFDLPPVSQTSVTSSIAGFMDMMLLVVEGEKTSRETLKQAASILGESAPHLSTVFNKSRTYVPEWLHQDI